MRRALARGFRRWRSTPVVLEATHEEALAIVPLADLRRHALDLN
jgi:uncharacterized protein (DUF2237 family)